MNKKFIFGLAVLALTQIGKAQTTNFYPNDVSDAFNAYGNNFDASGSARYIGMGGSMGALGGDLGAVETNPAGLGVYRNSEASISMSVLSNKNKASMSSSYSNTDTNFNIPSAGFVLALGDDSYPLKLNIGANFTYQRLDNDVIFPQDKNKTYTQGTGEYMFDGYEQYTNGYKSRMKFSIATNYMDKLYFGLGLDWHYLNIDRESRYYDRNTSTGQLSSFYEQLTPYYQDANGFGLSVGVIGKVIPELRLGAAYHSPVWWSDINYDYTIYGTDNNGDVYQEYWYYDKQKITTPGKLVLSGAFASDILNEDNSLAVNFDFINYFNKDTEFKGDTEYRLNNNFVDRYMQDSQEYRAGIEYRYKELKLRAGYAYTSSPVKGKSVLGGNDLFTADIYNKNYLAGEKNKLSFGAGYDIGPFFIDAAYQFIKTDYYTTFSGDFYNYYSNESVSFDNNTPAFGKVKNTQNNFILTLGMRF